MNEIALLRRLEGNDRIIRLIESEVKGGSKGHLMLVCFILCSPSRSAHIPYIR